MYFERVRRGNYIHVFFLSGEMGLNLKSFKYQRGRAPFICRVLRDEPRRNESAFVIPVCSSLVLSLLARKDDYHCEMKCPTIPGFVIRGIIIIRNLVKSYGCGGNFMERLGVTLAERKLFYNSVNVEFFQVIVQIQSLH